MMTTMTIFFNVRAGRGRKTSAPLLPGNDQHMQTHEFENLVRKHSLDAGILYHAVALAGEVGEVCNNLKKVIMVRLMAPTQFDALIVGVPPLISETDLKEKVIDELGDTLFYLVKLALDNGVTIDQLMSNQQVKLNDQSDKYKRIFLK